MKKFIIFFIGAFCLHAFCFGQNKIKIQAEEMIVSGAEWYDTSGKPINAHGGGLLYHNGVYYWYGEYKGDSTYWNPKVQSWECYRTEAGGVSCYSSRNLTDWKFEGIVLPPEQKDTASELHFSNVLERPKVIYNEETKKFVMWLHVDSHDYAKAAAGVAISDSPVGLFKYLGSMRPNGQMSRDMKVFKDDNGKAYQVCSSENNATLYINELTDDYLKPSGRFTRNFINEYREAPAVFKYNGKYYIVTSACTGWDPNQAKYAVADSMLGHWEMRDNPCTGKDADKTFYGQSTHVLPIEGKKNAYIAMFDRWNKKDLINSRYIWLPIIFEGDSIEIQWKDRWEINKFFK
ncbi:MAG TPA: glycoside hydrolase family 43 protein [Bacteroidales bacterium]|nr:glycoside hydrolase family 43 protein [Bacteroidales bacterium]